MNRITTKKNIRHKKIIKANKGFRGSNSTLFKTAKQKNIKALTYSYSGRKTKKQFFRKLWIKKINSQTKTKYNKFIEELKENKILINRKILSKLIEKDSNILNKII